MKLSYWLRHRGVQAPAAVADRTNLSAGCCSRSICAASAAIDHQDRLCMCYKCGVHALVDIFTVYSVGTNEEEQPVAIGVSFVLRTKSRQRIVRQV